jgi:hypothetical protein
MIVQVQIFAKKNALKFSGHLVAVIETISF